MNRENLTESLHCEEFCVHDVLLQELEEKKISDEDSQDIADLFKVLGDSSRVKILYYLLQQELCVCDLSVLVGSSQSAVSHQLRVLRNFKIVQGTKIGKQVIYKICDPHIKELLMEASKYFVEKENLKIGK